MLNVKKYSPDYSSLVNEGGFGDIYRCKQDPNVVVKMTKNLGKIYNGECNKKIIKKLFKHNNLMNIMGVDECKYGGIDLIYLEYIEGLTLSKYLKNYTLSYNNIINITKQILSGLSFLHQNKITHRDINLNNIILNDKNMKIKIIDFGLACYGYPCKNLVGTSGFFAPEMIYNSENYGSKCDIWSLGCILYYMVCKYYPFYFCHEKDYYIEQLKDKVIIPYHNNDWQNKNLHNLCQNMLVYNNQERWSAKKCYSFIQSI